MEWPASLCTQSALQEEEVQEEEPGVLYQLRPLSADARVIEDDPPMELTGESAREALYLGPHIHRALGMHYILGHISWATYPPNFA